MSNFDNMSNSAKSFSQSLIAMADHMEGSTEKVIRKACFDLYRRIVKRTPVDTGRAKAGWMISTDHGDYASDEKKYSESEISSLINEHSNDFLAERIEDQVIIYNNLEYIKYLEDGTSDQAPAGMVVVSLADFENHFNDALLGLEGLEPA